VATLLRGEQLLGYFCLGNARQADQLWGATTPLNEFFGAVGGGLHPSIPTVRLKPFPPFV